MVFKNLELMKSLKWLWSMLMAPVSPKNLRVSAILIAIYQALISSVGLFIALLGLAHAKQMKNVLAEDIAEQDDLGPYYESNPYQNQTRLFNASTLAAITEFVLYVATGVTSINFLTCISLFIGVLRNRSLMCVPWLVFDFITIVVTVLFMCCNTTFASFTGDKWQYWLLCLGYIGFDAITWYIVYAYFLNLCEIRKLTEIATVAIPCPPPGANPYYYRPENMYLGSNGYKHILHDNRDVENLKI